jgi:hypothetical protein
MLLEIAPKRCRLAGPRRRRACRALPLPRLRPLRQRLGHDNAGAPPSRRLPEDRRRLRRGGGGPRRSVCRGDLLAGRASTAGQLVGRGLRGYCDGAQEARELHGVEVRLTPDITRSYDLDAAELVVRHAAAYLTRGVVGVASGDLKPSTRRRPSSACFASSATTDWPLSPTPRDWRRRPDSGLPRTAWGTPDPPRHPRDR